MTHKPESQENLWMLVISPSVWAIHFLACYLTSAIWCAKFAKSVHGPATVQWAMIVYTLIALAAIAITGWIGHRRHRSRVDASGPHDKDTHDDRHSFIGFAMLLLAGLSAIATIYVGLVALFVKGC